MILMFVFDLSHDDVCLSCVYRLSIVCPSCVHRVSIFLMIMMIFQVFA